MRITSFLIASSLPLLQIGCSLSCTEAGCDDALVLDMEQSTDFEPGTYLLSIESDRGPVTCTWVVPSLPGVGGAGGASNPPVDTIENCDDDSFDGLAYTDRSQRKISLTLSEPVDELSITLSRDSATLYEADLTPEYEEYYANSKRCDEEACRSATESLNLD